MVQGWILIACSFIYISALFGIAYYGDRHSYLYNNRFIRPQIYSLSMAVYFTSWTFYGAVGRASTEGLGFLPIYLGPLLTFFFFGSIIDRIIRISKKQSTTSIADFIAARYGKSQIIAVLVTTIAVIGIIPYIALQLKAVSMGFSILTTGDVTQDTSSISLFKDTAWWIALLMALFTIIFGTRHLDATEHHQGMMQAVAFESIIKMVAFVFVGLFVCYSMFNGVDDIFTRINQSSGLEKFSLGGFSSSEFIAQTIISMCAIICLPRQFHVTVVENYHRYDFQVARVMMPLYLIIASAFVLPIAGAGWLMFDEGTVNADTLVLNLPIIADQKWLTILAFLGGGSAATAMVIVSSVTLSTMVCNEIVIPIIFKLFQIKLNQQQNLSRLFLNIRRITIVLLLLLAYGFYRLTAQDFSLTSFGLLSFVAVAQFAPALIGGVMWRRGNFHGAVSGLTSGFLIWVYTLLLPTLARNDWISSDIIERGLFNNSWLTPASLFGSEMQLITHGIVWSLGVNLFLYITVSLFTRQRVREKIQAAAFFHEVDISHQTSQLEQRKSNATIDDLKALSERFMGPEKADAVFMIYETRFGEKLSPGRHASPNLLKFIEKQLASAIGSSTAKVVLDSTLKGRDMHLEDVVSIVDEASQVMQFNRDLLQSAIENISMGVSVIDEQQRIVAWNQRYLSLFNYPKGFVQVGRPIADLVRLNLIAANLPPGKIESLIEERLKLMQDGTPHEYERDRPDGSVLLIQGNPTPGGGFVTTFADITDLKKTTQALKETNTYLEQRVEERTQELSVLNDQLLQAKSVAEQANQSKTRFLASASHDLLQPLNAARLFTSALHQQHQEQDKDRGLIENIDHSLTAAEEILSTLLDISKLDAGVLETHVIDFCIQDVLKQLNAEFTVIAENQNLTLKTVPCYQTVHSDSQLLRRVIQNFLSNAIRYTPSGKILMGCRRLKGFLRIEVWDTGPGISENDIKSIFEEFKRLPHHGHEKKGLGLGLAIVDRVSHILGHPIKVTSTLGKGSVFSITVPIGKSKPAPTANEQAPISARKVGGLEDLNVLCIDNDPTILEGMATLLRGWKCQVIAASSLADAQEKCPDKRPEIILADYQLDNDENGLDTMDQLQSFFAPISPDTRIPGVLVTAQTGDALVEEVHERGYQILHKPVKPAALRAMMTKLIKSQTKK